MGEINKSKLRNSFKEILNNSDSLTNNCDLPNTVEENGNELFKELYYDYRNTLEKLANAILDAIE